MLYVRLHCSWSSSSRKVVVRSASHPPRLRSARGVVGPLLGPSTGPPGCRTNRTAAACREDKAQQQEGGKPYVSNSRLRSTRMLRE
jgi:hypothetical protein